MGYTVSRATLKSTLNEPVHVVDSSLAWANVVSIVEDKRTMPKVCQGMEYCRTLKRYRPDLKLIYGLSIVRKTCIVYSCDAATTRETDYFDIRYLDNLYAYVYAVYTSVDARNPDLSAVPGLQGQAWRLRYSLEGSEVQRTFAPFHVGHPKGRMTWVGVEADSLEKPTGILKMSWQDEQRRFREQAIYAKIHSDKKWMPGVARPVTCYSPSAQKLDDRSLSVVLLESIGDPLSECRNVKHLLETMFDAVEG